MLKQIIEISKNPDFLAQVKALKQINIKSFKFDLVNECVKYYDLNQQSYKLDTMNFTNSYGKINKDAFKLMLKKHQNQELDFTTFCNQSLEYGVAYWIVDLSCGDVSYYSDQNQIIYKEEF